MANTPFDTRLASESTEAFHAFSIYRDLGLKRSLDEVSRRFDAEKRGSGFRLITGAEVAKPRKSGKIGLWSRKFRWVERAAAWDALVDTRIREKTLDEIGKMAARHATQSQASLEMLMAPVWAFLRGMQNKDKAEQLENLDMGELLKASILSSMQIPRAQKAERLARGVKVLDTEPVSNAGSTQGGATWNVTVYQPERKEPPPDLHAVKAQQPDEWEKA